MPTTMTVKGQITIPKAVRERAGLRPGSRVDVTSDRFGEILIMPVADDTERDVEARIDAVARRFQAQDQYSGMSTDDYMAMVREPVASYAPPPPSKR